MAPPETPQERATRETRERTDRERADRDRARTNPPTGTTAERDRLEKERVERERLGPDAAAVTERQRVESKEAPKVDPAAGVQRPAADKPVETGTAGEPSADRYGSESDANKSDRLERERLGKNIAPAGTPTREGGSYGDGVTIERKRCETIARALFDAVPANAQEAVRGAINRIVTGT